MNALMNEKKYFKNCKYIRAVESAGARERRS